MAARIAIIAMTTSSSISVKPALHEVNAEHFLEVISTDRLGKRGKAEGKREWSVVTAVGRLNTIMGSLSSEAT
jgi:hypothetical protein